MNVLASFPLVVWFCYFKPQMKFNLRLLLIPHHKYSDLFIQFLFIYILYSRIV